MVCVQIIIWLVTVCNVDISQTNCDQITELFEVENVHFNTELVLDSHTLFLPKESISLELVWGKKGHWSEHVSAWIRVNWFGPWVSQSFLTFGKELNKFYKCFFSFCRAFITSNVDICRSDSWYCLDNSFHDYDHFILCQNASLLLSIGFFKQTQTVRYWKVRFF